MPAFDTRARHIIAERIASPVCDTIVQLAQTVRAGHGRGVVAVIAYGSCLRGVPAEESLVDFYLLTNRFDDVSANPLARLACRMLPPNVHYAQASSADGSVLRAKYAVLPLDQFARRMKRDVSNPYFWARFSQPCALVWVDGEQTRKRIVAALEEAAATMLAAACGLGHDITDARAAWVGALAATYASELRAEGPERAGEIHDRDAAYYRAISAALVAAPGTVEPLRANWPLRHGIGKLLSALRLAKAAFTFTGGADYLAWKISRHSGHKVELTPWQRRHPILASLVLLPRLLRQGAVR